MEGIVSTIKDKCRQCYSCVRHCPVKAVKINNGQAEVLYDRCISCGNCVLVCSQNAKNIRSDIPQVKGLLRSGKPVVACLAPSFPAVFRNISPGQVCTALKLLGFDGVMEVALGAQLILAEYKKVLAQSMHTVISTPCPAVVNLVEKHFPELLQNLAPVVSPMEALARFIKKVRGPECAVVFIGPCIAKKDEQAKSFQVDAVLTFDELKELMHNMEIDPAGLNESGFNGPEPEDGPRTFAISGGLLHALGRAENVLLSDILIVEGKEDCLSMLESLKERRATPKFIDMLFCKGCISGPVMKGLNVYSSQQEVTHFILNGTKEYEDQKVPIPFDLDLSREFVQRKKNLPIPTEQEIREILAHTGKNAPGDELNCGACGYASCRDKAVAVFQGIAEIEMCLPYLLEVRSRELGEIKELNEELDAIIDSSYDGIWVSDREGVARKINMAFAQMIGLKKEDIIGKNVLEFERQKVIYPSVTLLVLREKRRVTLVQETRTGKKVLATGTPVFDGDGEISFVIVNVRDIFEFENLKNEIEETTKIKKYFERSAHADNDIANNIVAFSAEMERVLGLARKVARVDSTVLILGESGVGKDVVARYIHEMSSRSGGPYIKINCGAIPESLLESELFGYETGAFTGAKRQGKPGLIEMANTGTLFLDEIAELPLNLQVKLLQVIQEHQLVRIGGLKPVSVDIRVITATNQDIEKMVSEGRFREDLYYRLNVVPVTIPPLRLRRDDIIPLVHHFVDRVNQKYGLKKSISKEAREIMLNYHWPGNVRQLENIVERLMVTVEDEVIQPRHLPELLKQGAEGDGLIAVTKVMPLRDAIEQVEKQLILKALEGGRSTYEAAKLLGINQSTVVRKLQKFKGNASPH